MHRRLIFTVLLFTLVSCALANEPTSAPYDQGQDTRQAEPMPGTSLNGSPQPALSPGNPAGLTDAEMIGQLLLTHVYGGSADEVTAEQRAANLALYGVETPEEVLRRFHLGGIVLLNRNTLDSARAETPTGNVQTSAQLHRFTSELQSVALDDIGWPLLIAVDQEGGRVQRIKTGVIQLPSQQELADTQNPAELACTYRSLGLQLRALGINQNFAPVADVARSSSGVIGDRSYGGDVARTKAAVLAAVRGLQSAGVLATLKHWPGHGATSIDSHERLPVLRESRAGWERIDRPPFAGAIDQVDAVMVGHLALPAVDGTNRPATLSQSLVNGELRQALNFDGVVITDSLWMQPMRAAGTPSQVALTALTAGNDMLLMPVDLPSVYGALIDAVQRDPATRKTVQTAVVRILDVKQSLISQEPTPLPCQ